MDFRASGYPKLVDLVPLKHIQINHLEGHARVRGDVYCAIYDSRGAIAYTGERDASVGAQIQETRLA